MSLRARLIVLAAICVIAVGGSVGYVISSRNHQKEVAAHESPVAQVSLPMIEQQPRIVFRNTALGTSYGMVAMVSLRDPAGPRAITGTSCDRVYATARNVLCVSTKLGVVTTHAAHVLDNAFTATQALPLTGDPSRARLSRDGTLAATTSFVAGDSYAGASFSTRTVISRVGGSVSGNLEDYTLIHDGKAIKPVDRNFWGVTFAADDDTFYATAEWAQHTWLVRGSISKRQVVTLH